MVGENQYYIKCELPPRASFVNSSFSLIAKDGYQAVMNKQVVKQC